METQYQPAIVDLAKWKIKAADLRDEYRDASPYPHIVLNDFLDPATAHKAMTEFPGVTDAGWIHYVHVNEKKHGLNKTDRLPPFIRTVIEGLNEPEFCEFLSELTGIHGLLPDPDLEGGGLHQSGRGGYLNIHADFTVHPHKRNWRRRVNLLVYLNENWLPEYRGELELWERDMSRCAVKVLPVFNRAVIFNTDEDSFHGLPDPIACPEGMTRKSIALYYFTEEKEPPRKRSTNYRARPGDGVKSFFIWMDKQVVAVYSNIKSRLGLNDDFASNILRKFSRKKKS